MSEPTNEALLAEIRHLRSRLESLEAAATTASAPTAPAEATPESSTGVSRRKLFGIAGAGVAGAAVLGTAKPAAADALTAPSAGDGEAIRVGNSQTVGNGANLADRETELLFTGTLGNAGDDLLTLRNEASNHTGAVLEVDQRSTQTAARGIEVQHAGNPGSGPGILVDVDGGSGATGVQVEAGSGKGIQVTQSNSSAGIRIDQSGTGNSINANGTASQTSSNINSATAGSGAAVAATNTGAGNGVEASGAVGVLATGTTAVNATGTTTGVVASGPTGAAITGTTTGATVSGPVGATITGTTGTAVEATGSNADATVQATNSAAAVALAGAANAVRGDITASDNGSHAVLGVTAGGGHAVAGLSAASTATTWGRNTGAGAGIGGENTGSGVGGAFRGGTNRGSVVLEPAGTGLGSAAGAPTAGTHVVGELYVDGEGDLYYCTTAGTPGTFTKLNDQSPTGGGSGDPSLTLLAEPVRAFDSRSGKAPTSAGPGNKGRFSAGENRVIDLNSAATGIPSGATAAVVNLTLINGDGPNGFLSIYSNAQANKNPPSFSSINWFTAGQIAANELTVAIDAQAKIKVYASRPCDVAVDVIGYYA